MISPLSPVYLNQTAISQTVPNPQAVVIQQDQTRQSQIQLPVAPPLQETEPKQETKHSTSHSGDQQEALLQENRSEHLQFQQRPHIAYSPGATGAPDTQQSAEKSQTQALVKASAGEVSEKNEASPATDNDDSSTTKTSAKVKSIYVQEDPVITGQMVDSVA